MTTEFPRKTTRRHLLDALKTGGPQSADSLAAPLGITTMAVRQHLYSLEEQGLVASENVAGQVGRPKREWHLTEAADRYFPDAHAELSVSLISLMRDTFGEEGLNRVMEARKQQQISDYSNAMKGAGSVGDRLTILADIRSREGYMASAEPADDGSWILVERHCPVCIAASSCTGICSAELDVFRSVIGPGYAVEREQHMLSGEHRCAYRVRAQDDAGRDTEAMPDS